MCGSCPHACKNDIEVFFKFLKCTFLDKSPQKIDGFALNIQYILSLQEIGQYKTKETLEFKSDKLCL